MNTFSNFKCNNAKIKLSGYYEISSSWDILEKLEKYLYGIKMADAGI